ncbi:MAG: hypothetical protein PHW02_01205 [bacterium]|nr:hypothetical protein [bacterium]
MKLKIIFIFIISIFFFTGCLPMLEQAELLEKNSVVASVSGYHNFIESDDSLYSRGFDNYEYAFGGIQVRAGLSDKLEVSGQMDFDRICAGAKFLLFERDKNIVTAKISMGSLILHEIMPSMIKPALFYGRKLDDNAGVYAGTSVEYAGKFDYAGMLFAGVSIRPMEGLMHAIKLEGGFIRKITYSHMNYFYAGISFDFQIF